MITILGTKITVFALYGLFSLQLLAVLFPIFGYKTRHFENESAIVPVMLFVFGCGFEIAVIVWVASI